MSLLSLFVTLLVLCLVFGVAFWLITLVVSVVPPPMKQPAMVVLSVLLGIIAIVCLLDLAGFIGTTRHFVIALR